MKTTEELEEIYDSEPYEWIALWKNRGVWVKIINPSFIHECHYQLIHIKHKEVLEAYLADDKVEIKFYLPYVMCTDDTELEATWEVDDNFIENYNPDLEYQLKEDNIKNNSIPTIKVDEDLDKQVDVYFKEKEDGDRAIPSSKVSSTRSDNMYADEKVTSFTAHGFEVPSWDGEILREVDGEYFGYVFNIEIARNVAIKWSPLGVVLTTGMNRFKLAPIKKHWWNNPANFPVRLVRDTEYYTTYRWVSDKDTFVKSHRQGFKLVTEDNCTLVGSMF